MPITVVQQIRTIWTKASRGGRGAVRRNAIAEAAKVPLHRVDTAGLRLLHHKLAFWEKDFSSPSEEIIRNPDSNPLVLGCVTIRWTEQQVQADFAWRWDCGAPNRELMCKTMQLAVNEWGQIVYNGRFAPWYSGNWWYEKTVVNVGLFEPPSASVFTRNEPTDRYSAMGHLL